MGDDTLIREASHKHPMDLIIQLEYDEGCFIHATEVK